MQQWCGFFHWHTLWRNEHSDRELVCLPRIRCVAFHFACIDDSSPSNYSPFRNNGHLALVVPIWGELPCKVHLLNPRKLWKHRREIRKTWEERALSCCSLRAVRSGNWQWRSFVQLWTWRFRSRVFDNATAVSCFLEHSLICSLCGSSDTMPSCVAPCERVVSVSSSISNFLCEEEMNEPEPSSFAGSFRE